MKRAFFVEGYTELQLIKRLAIYYYGEQNINFALYKLRGGNKKPITVTLVENHTTTSSNTIFVYDCGGFVSIKSMVLYQRASLQKNNFEKIIAIRDLHPNSHTEIPKILLELPYFVPQKPIPIKFLLCVYETESWFIAEHKHFLNISNQLTKQNILQAIGLDLDTTDVEQLNTPSKYLDDIYKIAGMNYTKNQADILRTINSLDLFDFFEVLPTKIHWLGVFLNELK